MGNPIGLTTALPKAELSCGAARLVADRSGAAYWPDERTLIVADLHFEKASFFSARGVMLPPYDTQTTIAKLTEVIERRNPARVIALGDSFHDSRGGARLNDANRAALRQLQAGREWHWITGNHDPERIEDVGGHFSSVLRVRDVTFRHQPGNDENEVVGHFHPVAAIPARGRRMRLRCFAESRTRIVLPAFGSLTGGLDVRHSAFAAILGPDFVVHVWAAENFYSLPACRLPRL